MYYHNKNKFVLWVQLIVVSIFNIYYVQNLLNFTLNSLNFSCIGKILFFYNNSYDVMIG